MRRRVRVVANLDGELVRAVDRYVFAHARVERSTVIEEALREWLRQREAPLRRR